MAKHQYLFQREDKTLRRVRYTDFSTDITNLKNTKMDTTPYSYFSDTLPRLYFKSLDYTKGNITASADSYSNRSIFFLDKNNNNLAAIYSTINYTGDNSICLRTYKNDLNSPDDIIDFRVTYPKDTSIPPYVYCPTPSKLLNRHNAVATTTYVTNNCSIVNKEDTLKIYVGGTNESDTADLYTKRGYSAEYPFATLQAAMSFVEKNIVSPTNAIEFRVSKDVTLGGSHYLLSPASYYYIIPTDTFTQRTLTLTSDFNLIGGFLRLYNINIDCKTYSINVCGLQQVSYLKIETKCIITGTSYRINVAGPLGLLYFEGDIAVNGKVKNDSIGSWLKIGYYGTVICDQATFSSTLTMGRKYYMDSGARMFTGGKGSSLPGTDAGRANDTSISFY